LKLIHIADLHIGKRVNEFCMIEDQNYILNQIIDIVKDEKCEGVLIAGDVYDKSIPSADAVELLDEFLTKLINLKQKVFLISGNHDSAERLDFGSRIMNKNGLFINGVFNRNIYKGVLKDKYGPINIFLLPHIKPIIARAYYGDDYNIETYDDAVRTVMSNLSVDKTQRNIILSHQFVTYGAAAPERSESEQIFIGGMDNVNADVFDAFDYAALGHLHGPQRIYKDTIRYAGSPLKYSFSETRQKKSITVLELREKGDINIRQAALKPKRDMREIKGPIAELLKIGREDKTGAKDYIRAIITDEEEIYDAIGQLRGVYANIMCVDFENSRTEISQIYNISAADDISSKTPVELFSDFYENQNNSELTKEQMRIIQSIFEQAGGSPL